MSLRSETRSPAFKRQMKEKCGDRCVNCGNAENVEYHHIVPLSLGGTNNLSNIVPLCHKCHEAAHRGRHISHYRNIKDSGRKTNLPDDKACRIFDMYITGQIGNRKSKELFGYSQRTQMKDLVQFRKYMESKGIADVHNIVDIVATNSPEKLKNGCSVGKIIFQDGHSETIRYNDTGANDIEYTHRKSASQH